MLRFLADENLNIHLVKGLQRRSAQLDIVRVQDVGLATQTDPLILAWAADHGRIVITHDVETFPPFAYQRIHTGQPMPGVFIVPWTASIGSMIDDLLVLAECSVPDEWEGRIRFLPL